MSTVIYLFNQQVQILSGKAGKNSIAVKKSYMETAPEGSIINGLIMDVEMFVGFLKGLVADGKIPAKDVTLVVSSTKFVGRTIELPVLNEKKSFDYITREFADIGKTSDSLYGYITLTGAEKGFRKVYAENIEPDFVKDYIDIFAEAGIKLKGIYSGESCLIDFTGNTIAKVISNFELLIADVNSITTVLWVEGAFFYYNSTRTFNDPGTEGYASDIARTVSQMNQFMQTRHIETPLESIFIAGVEQEDMAIISEAIRSAGVNTQVEHFKLRNATGLNTSGSHSFLRAVTGLYTHPKTSNFLQKMSSKGAKKEESGETKKAKLAIIIALGIMLILTSSLYSYKSARAQIFKEIDDYINSPETQMEVMTYDRVAERNNFLTQQYSSIDDINKNIDTYPLGDEKVIKYIDKCADGYAQIKYDSFYADEGDISFTAVAEDVETINKFIKNLSDETIFKNVDYTGYRYDDAENMWNINVTCKLAEAAGKEEK